MRTAQAIILLAGGLFLASSLYVKNLLLPNTYLNDLKVGLKPKDEILTYLAKHKNPDLSIKVENRVYRFTYRDLGVVFDLNGTYSDLVGNSSGIGDYWSALAGSRTIMPKFIFTQDYYDRIENMQFDFSTSTDQITVDPQKKNLVYQNNQELFVIDPKSLETEIISHFGDKKVLKPRIHRVFNHASEIKVHDYNRQIKKVLAQPVAIFYENGTETVTELSPADLTSLVSVDYDSREGLVSVGVDGNRLEEAINGLNRKLNLKTDLTLDRSDLRAKLISLVSGRFNGLEVNDLYVRLVESPNTRGEAADRYIEVDISQQKMYLWENRQNIAIHRISSGLYYPTPPGKYKILNKAQNAYSYIYHVWMPYWMAFSLDPKVNAYLGIHELPYWVDSGGQEIRRPRDFIGSPHTGGCVSLDIGEAEKVYAWAEVGDPVLIFD